MGVLQPTPYLGLAYGAWKAYKMYTQSPQAVPQTKGPWRPPQWQGAQSTTITVTRPIQQGSVVSHTIIETGETGSTNTPPKYETVTYYFDAYLRLDHHQEVRATEQPIQVGAAISDHAYMMPARLLLEIGMSDAMDRINHSQFTSNPSKSVSAFEELLRLQRDRFPMTVTTRLRTYENMIIDFIRAPDDRYTKYGLRAQVSFREMLYGFVATQTDSARPHETDVTNEGSKASSSPSLSDTIGHKVESILDTVQLLPSHIPGAGFWTSNTAAQATQALQDFTSLK